VTYYTKQKQKAESLFESLFHDPGNGFYRGKNRSFILSDPLNNLWSDIRHEALTYFNDQDITWWGSGNQPTNHPLSSQIACINYLYPIRQREDMATALLRVIDPDIDKAVPLDTGYVEFEMTGKEKLGGERILKRGANCTSIDAMMLGETKSSSRILFLIEWKYVEDYRGQKSKRDTDGGDTRFENYKDLLGKSDCPVIHPRKEDLFYEPFYQLMRQTLLGWEMVKRNDFEYGAADWRHVHAIPRDNLELRNTVTSPNLGGDTLEAAWKQCLKEPEKYIVIDPGDWFQSLKGLPDVKAWLGYLEKRYW